MSEKEQIDAMAKDLTALIQRYIDEFDLSTAAAVGVLECKKYELIKAATEDDSE